MEPKVESKGCIYYTHNRLNAGLFKACQDQLRQAFKGEIVSVSLKPLVFGRNIVVDLEPGVLTMQKQILVALENSTADIIFFTEHDCLYSPSHFDFIPEDDNTFYYNINVWRWKHGSDKLITYDGLTSLSGMCAKRKLLLSYYRKRVAWIESKHFPNERDPKWARVMGYEPGTKKRRNGGFTDEKWATWRSAEPNIDIRHSKTITPPKTSLESFKHKPVNWQEININEMKSWNLKNYQF